MSKAQVVDVSGVLTVMTLGMFFAAAARKAFKGENQQSLHHFWEMVAYIANTLIFILSGVVIAEGILRSDSHIHNSGTSWTFLILLYVLVQVSRMFVVGTLYPFLRYFGYGLDWKEGIILIWSGLRGAVAISLSLSVKRSSDKSYSSLLTLEIGTLMRILEYTRYEMLNKAMDAFGDLGDDEELGPADWPTVKRYLTCLSSLEGRQVRPHNVSETENHQHSMNLRDRRVRLLNGVQAAYWGMLEEERITQSIAILLMQSVDEAIDLVDSEPLCDWKGVKSHIHFPRYYKFLQMSFCPPKLVIYFTVERLESACYICSAFLRAHRIARNQLQEFIGESEIASIVISESDVEEDEARKFLEDVRVEFPQVLRVVKTRQATYSILKHLSDYVQNLGKAGLLEEEIFQLHEGVQTDLKRLLRNPPLVKMPKPKDMLSVHPLLGALPTTVRGPIEASTKEIMKLRGVTLYREGSKATGIWLISNGVVKWSSKRLKNRHSFHPTFSHGSTLGLYEVLVGKPYICDVITDSVLHCFFVDAEKIISMLGSDSAVGEFLWKESATTISKLLLPQIFEKMSMQELQTLIAERSSMKIYIRGEIIELCPHNICFILEGFVRTQDTQEILITSPAALLSSHGDPVFQSIEYSGSKTESFVTKEPVTKWKQGQG